MDTNSPKYVTYGLCGYEKDKVEPITNPGANKFSRGVASNKPAGGLWASPEYTSSSWKEFCKRENFRLCEEDNKFVFEILPEAKIFTINKVEDVNYLLNKYPFKADPKFYEKNINFDWEKIAEDYDVISYSLEQENDDKYWAVREAMSGWDCTSVIVLNPEKIMPKEDNIPNFAKKTEEEILDDLACGKYKYNNLPNEWKVNENVALAALDKNIMSYKNIPTTAKTYSSVRETYANKAISGMEYMVERALSLGWSTIKTAQKTFKEDILECTDKETLLSKEMREVFNSSKFEEVRDVYNNAIKKISLGYSENNGNEPNEGILADKVSSRNAFGYKVTDSVAPVNQSQAKAMIGNGNPQKQGDNHKTNIQQRGIN